MMDDDEIKEISQTMATLGTVSATMVERCSSSSPIGISSTGSLVGTFESTERLLIEA
jgi:flagellar motor switch protein FliG